MSETFNYSWRINKEGRDINRAFEIDKGDLTVPEVIQVDIDLLHAFPKTERWTIRRIVRVTRTTEEVIGE